MHAAEDEKRRSEIETRNRADAMIDSTEKTLSEHRDKIGADDAKKVEEALAAAKEAVKSGDSAATERALENLTQAGHKLAEAMYQSPGAASGGASGAPRRSGSGRRRSQRGRRRCGRRRRRGRRVRGCRRQIEVVTQARRSGAGSRLHRNGRLTAGKFRDDPDGRREQQD